MDSITGIARNVRLFLSRRPGFIFTTILLTYRCSQRCLQCNIPNFVSDTPEISPDTLRIVCERLKQHGTRIIALSGGEPAIHPRFAEIAGIVAGYGFVRKHIRSNLFYKDEIFEQVMEACFRYGYSLSTSLDGLGPSADIIRGGKDVFDVVGNHMQRLTRENRKRGKPLRLSTNIVISGLNIQQIPAIISFIERAGWHFNIDIYRWGKETFQENEAMKITDPKALARALEYAIVSPANYTPVWYLRTLPQTLERKPAKKCPYILSPTFGSKYYIHPNGDVKACMGEAVGNLTSHTIDEILDGELWKERLGDIRYCKGCWNTCYTVNSSIATYFNPDTIMQYLL